MNIFFCGGIPKSGTTLLQRILDLHPDVGCSSEENINFIANNFIKLHADYNQKLLIRAKRIGSENCPLINQDVFIKSLFDLLKEIAIDRNKGKKFFGISDNHFLPSNINSLLSYFNKSKIILIFRNPIDTALSTWDHNHRLYKDEKFEKHLDLLKVDNDLNIEKYVIQRSKIWNEDVNKIFNQINKNKDDILIIRYEDLCNNKTDLVLKIFTFLGASIDQNIITDIVQNSSLKSMKVNSSNPNFFSKGRINFGYGDLPNNIIKEVLEICEEGMGLLSMKLPKI